MEGNNIDGATFLGSKEIADAKAAISTLSRKRKAEPLFSFVTPLVVQNNEIIPIALARKIAVDNAGINPIFRMYLIE
jgi:hypothetical protein